MNSELRVDGTRLWNRLMEMAQIGATPKGGVCREALTDEDKVARDLFARWCREANLEVSVDQFGNMFARREGRNPDLAPVLFGSHLDSQPTGGKFDGAYGVLAAFEAIETLNDNNIQTEHPLEIVNWTNEEGARFPPGIIGSGVYTGVYTLEFGLNCADRDGITMGQELQRIGYAGDLPAEPRDFKATFEIHIEQGPILENEKKEIGIVTHVQGLHWYQITIEGKEGHAGSTPMPVRRDPVKASLDMLKQLYALTDETPDLVITFGDIQTPPRSINTIPGQMIITVDMRHPDNEILSRMDQAVRRIVAESSTSTGLGIEIEELSDTPAVSFDAGCIESVRRAAEVVGAPAREMISGAGHDAMQLARIAPTCMIFIPCEDGLSHNELENITPEDAAAGANVLLHAVLDQAAV